MRIYIILISVFLITACSSSQKDRLKWVGKEPPLNEVKVPEEKVAPIRWPVKSQEIENGLNKNSLWNNRAGTFFGDNRARNIGDILTIDIQIADKAELDNKTERTRTESDNVRLNSLFGLAGEITRQLPNNPDVTSLVDKNTQMDNIGDGTIEREEVVETKVAAVVTQLTGNGNLVVYGSQEIRVNNEIRQLTVEGVVRPEDISPSNMVDYSRIAEARISYGGKGIISDLQRPRVGNEILDIVSPF